MSEQPSIQARLATLTRQVDQLISQCVRLREENHGLRQSQESLALERAQLIARSDQARSRVEAMIERLKTLESPRP